MCSNDETSFPVDPARQENIEVMSPFLVSREKQFFVNKEHMVQLNTR